MITPEVSTAARATIETAKARGWVAVTPARRATWEDVAAVLEDMPPKFSAADLYHALPAVCDWAWVHYALGKLERAGKVTRAGLRAQPGKPKRKLQFWRVVQG